MRYSRISTKLYIERCVIIRNTDIEYCDCVPIVVDGSFLVNLCVIEVNKNLCRRQRHFGVCSINISQFISPVWNVLKKLPHACCSDGHQFCDSIFTRPRYIKRRISNFNVWKRLPIGYIWWLEIACTPYTIYPWTVGFWKVTVLYILSLLGCLQ